MTKPTKQELLCTFLKDKKGLKEVRGKTSKYRVFQISQDKFYFKSWKECQRKCVFNP